MSEEDDWPGAARRSDKDLFAAQLLLPRRARLREAYDHAASLWSAHTGAATSRYQLVPRVTARPAVAAQLAPRLWESYATQGFVPARWVDDPQRRFVRGSARLDARSRLARLFDRASSAPQPGFLDALAFAADARSVAAVEALAQQVLAALRPWGLADNPARCVLWRSVEGNHPQRLRSEESFAAGKRAAWAATHALGARRDTTAAQEQLVRSLVGDDRADALPWEGAALVDFVHGRRWAAAAALDLRVTVPEYVRDPTLVALRGARFAALPDPFAPLLDLWWRGYGLEAVGDDAVVLLVSRAPAIEPERAAGGAVVRGISAANDVLSQTSSS